MVKLDARMKGRPDLARARGGITLKLPPGLLPWLQAAVIIAAAAVIFWPVLHGDWLWDDNIDITENGITQGATGLWAIWFEPGTQLDYYPVKASVQWAQWHLWGKDTLGYHATNLVLHILSALLVWRLFRKLGLKLAWLGGLIFAVHPALVESVAWIAELKNTLSMPFFLLAALCYLNYDERRRRSDYLLAIGLFVLAMLTKPVMVMFPVAILGHAWWKRGRIARDDLKASVPFFAVSLVLGVVTLAMAFWYKDLHHQEPGLVPLGGLTSRLALMGLSLAFYLGKALWPAGLLPIYPQWPVNPPSLWQFLPWPVLGGLLFGLWWQRESWGRGLLFGIGFFLVMLFPFCGVVTVNYMNFTWVMDHFLYLPILGLIGLAVAGLDQAAQLAPKPVRYVGVVVLTAILAVMIAGSRAYAEKFVSQEALWTYTVEHNPGAWPAHNNLGNVMVQKGRIEEGIAHFQAALALNPILAEAHTNWGAALVREGKLSEGMAQYDLALALNSNNADTHYNYGNALSRAHRIPEAIQHYQRALEINPTIPEAHNNWGNALLDAGQPEAAARHFAEAVRMNPSFAEAQNNWGNALMKLGRFPEAIGHYQAALALKADYARANYNLGNAFLLSGRYPEAIAQYQLTLASDPGYADAYYNWGNALMKEGRFGDAVGLFEQALAVKPDYAAAHNNLGFVLSQTGRIPEAIEQFRETMRLDPTFAGAKQNIATLQAQAKSKPKK